MESYSRGRRGAPAKGVGVEMHARVQIPHSPPRKRIGLSPILFYLRKGFERSVKKSCQWQVFSDWRDSGESHQCDPVAEQYPALSAKIQLQFLSWFFLYSKNFIENKDVIM